MLALPLGTVVHQSDAGAAAWIGSGTWLWRQRRCNLPCLERWYADLFPVIHLKTFWMRLLEAAKQILPLRLLLLWQGFGEEDMGVVLIRLVPNPWA